MTGSQPSPDPRRSKFPPWRRLRASSEYQRVYSLRQRAGDGRLLVYLAANDLGQTRLGLSVSRKHGNSVVRHRLKRMFREAYRLEQHRLPEGLDLVVIPGQQARESSLDELRASLVSLVRRAARKRT